MPIKYVLSESRLISTAPDTYVARVIHGNTAEQEDVIAVMVQQGCTMFEADIAGTLTAYRQAIAFLLQQGRNVHTGVAKYSVGVGGTFTGPDDTFDPDRHKVRINVLADKRLVEDLQHTEWVKVEPSKPLPHPMHYTDVASDEYNSTLTPGGIGIIDGYRLRFDPTDPKEGIFFVAPSGASTRVETIVKNELRELIFSVPNLPAGEYRLEVRARARDGKALRTGALGPKLTVL